MELKFVVSNPDVRTSLKRSEACQSCRKRKKRCQHAFREGTEVGPRSPRSSLQIVTTVLEGDQNEDLSTSASSIASQTSPSDLQVKCPVWRFVGDLNPEALFHRQSETTCSPSRDNVGVWQSHQKRIEQSTSTARPGEGAHRVRPYDDISRPLNDGFQNTRQRPHDLLLPPINDQMALVRIYLEKINPVIPLIDETAFRVHSNASTSNLTSPILIQAMCLVAAKHYDAREHLRLAGDSELLTIRDFCHAMSSSLDMAFRNRVEKDKLTLIRALALSSQHVEGADGAEESSMQLMQAVHHAQTLGLHLDSARAEMQDESLGNLFWSLWGLDRLNACMNGRPIIMSNIDIGIKIRVSRLHNTKEFRAWLGIANMIDQVIEFYRPSADEHLTGWENDFPGFEEIIRDCEAINTSPDTLQTLELFYHAVAITSNRSRSFRNAPKSTPSSVRQAFSAISIIDILEEKNGRNLLPLPIVPYALSLALSVAYKNLRQTGLLTSRVRAMTQLKRCCTLLDALAPIWWSADAMAKIGRRALNEANKPPVANGTRTQQARYSEQAPHETEPRETSVNQVDVGWVHENPPTNTIVQRETAGRNATGVVTPADDRMLGLAPNNPSASNGDNDTVEGFAIDFNNPLPFGTTFDGIDQLLGDYLDLNLPTNFGDPLFVDDFCL